MPGVAKRKYIGECMRYEQRVKPFLQKIAEILPQHYDGHVLIDYYKKYYPTEWNNLSGMCMQYKAKDEFLQSIHRKARYKPLTPEEFFFHMGAVKRILSSSWKEKHANSYDASKREALLTTFENNRKKSIARHERKLSSKQVHMKLFFIQRIEPIYADKFIRSYHRKGCTTAEKLEIAIDLAKYDCPKVETFFYKLNDSERNDQLRHWAFRYLEARGKYARLRKNFKGKKKAYTKETAEFDVTPQDLIQRFSSTSVQNHMSFHVFVSHSIKNKSAVKKIIDTLNTDYGLTCYCDWGIDNDFLTRDKVGEDTKKALERRLKQSQVLLLVDSTESRKSSWVQWELDYFNRLNKPMYCVTIGKLDPINKFNFKEMNELEHYKNNHNEQRR